MTEAVTTQRSSSGGHPGFAGGYTLVLPTGWRQVPLRTGTKAAIRVIVNEAFSRYSPAAGDRDRVIKRRVQLEGRLNAMARQARSAGGIDLYLPAGYVHGTVVPASFIVSRATIAAESEAAQVDPAQVMAQFLAQAAGAAAGAVSAAASTAAAGTAAASTAAGDGTAGKNDATPAAAEGSAGDTAGDAAAGEAAAGESATPVTLGGVAAARAEVIAPADPGQGVAFGSRRVDYVAPVPGQPGQWLIITFSTVGDGDPAGDFATLLAELFDAIMATFRWDRAGQESAAR